MRPLATALACCTYLAAAIVPAAAAPARPDGPGHTFLNAGVKLWYEVRGADAGTPLVVVNGGPGFDHAYMLCSDVWDRLAARRPVVLYDQRGTGRAGAPEPGQSGTLRDQVADLEALRVQLGKDKIDLIGHSWGGFLIMTYAAMHPEHTNRLVIVDSAAPKWADTEKMSAHFYPDLVDEQARLNLRAALGDDSVFPRLFEITLHMRFVSAEKRGEFLARAGGFGFNPEVARTLRADVADMDLTPLLQTLTMPVLVVTGRHDLEASPGTAWGIHRAIPGARFAVLEKSGHVPFFEEPEAFLGIVEPFLDGR